MAIVVLIEKNDNKSASYGEGLWSTLVGIFDGELFEWVELDLDERMIVQRY